MASFNRIRQQHEGIYEYPNPYAFRNQYREGRPFLRAIQHIPEDVGTFEPEEFAREEYLGEHPVYDDQGRSIPSPTVSEVLLMREERRRQGLSAPTSVSVGSRLHSIRRVPSVHGSSRIYFEHHV